MSDEIDHRYTLEIICPHCGHAQHDSWERSNDDGVDECRECGKLFEWERYVAVTYSTKKKGQ